jgi:hypothetical protein
MPRIQSVTYVKRLRSGLAFISPRPETTPSLSAMLFALNCRGSLIQLRETEPAFGIR